MDSLQPVDSTCRYKERTDRFLSLYLLIILDHYPIDTVDTQELSPFVQNLDHLIRM